MPIAIFHLVPRYCQLPQEGFVDQQLSWITAADLYRPRPNSHLPDLQTSCYRRSRPRPRMMIPASVSVVWFSTPSGSPHFTNFPAFRAGCYFITRSYFTGCYPPRTFTLEYIRANHPRFMA